MSNVRRCFLTAGWSLVSNGASAEQVLMIVETEFDIRSEDEQESVRGTMYALTDTWGGMAAMVQRAESTDDDAGAPTKQVTLLRVTTHISDLRVDPIPASAFEIPSDYTQVDLFQPRADHK